MLEQEMSALRAAVETLTAQVIELATVMNAQAKPAAKVKPVKVEEAATPAETVVHTDTPNPEALSQQCLAIVRADSSKKAVVKDLIASFGGTTVATIAPADLPAFAIKLGELV